MHKKYIVRAFVLAAFFVVGTAGAAFATRTSAQDSGQKQVPMSQVDPSNLPSSAGRAGADIPAPSFPAASGVICPSSVSPLLDAPAATGTGSFSTSEMASQLETFESKVHAAAPDKRTDATSTCYYQPAIYLTPSSVTISAGQSFQFTLEVYYAEYGCDLSWTSKVYPNDPSDSSHILAKTYTSPTFYSSGSLTVSCGGYGGTGVAQITVTVVGSGGGGSNPCNEQSTSQLWATYIGGTINSQPISPAFPPTLLAGQEVQLSLTFRNDGACTLTAAMGIRAGSQNPENNFNWGTSRLYMSASANVTTGQQYTFTDTLKAPTTAGCYGFGWRLLREYVVWFGAPSNDSFITICVSGSVPPQSTSTTTTTANHPPVANFALPASCIVGQRCFFTDSSSDPDGSVTRWAWSFGDGTTDAAQSPFHVYSAAGTYTVTLTVTDDKGATGQTQKSLTVAAATSCTVTSGPVLASGSLVGDSGNPVVGVVKAFAGTTQIGETCTDSAGNFSINADPNDPATQSAIQAAAGNDGWLNVDFDAYSSTESQTSTSPRKYSGGVWLAPQPNLGKPIGTEDGTQVFTPSQNLTINMAQGAPGAVQLPAAPARRLMSMKGDRLRRLQQATAGCYPTVTVVDTTVAPVVFGNLHTMQDMTAIIRYTQNGETDIDVGVSLDGQNWKIAYGSSTHVGNNGSTEFAQGADVGYRYRINVVFQKLRIDSECGYAKWTRYMIKAVRWTGGSSVGAPTHYLDHQCNTTYARYRTVQARGNTSSRLNFRSIRYTKGVNVFGLDLGSTTKDEKSIYQSWSAGQRNITHVRCGSDDFVQWASSVFAGDAPTSSAALRR